MKTALSAVAALALATALSGCAGYRLGDVKPNTLKGVHKIAVNTFRNNTYLPRVESLVTNTVIKQIQQDGTYQITSAADADAILDGTITAVARNPARSLRGNVLATTEFNLAITVGWSLHPKTGAPLAAGSISGGTSFFVGSDVTTDERQAIPLAAEDLAVRLVSQISEGW